MFTPEIPLKRKAIIIYMTDSGSGKLIGPKYDNKNIRNFLCSDLGGGWNDSEIVSLNNPTKNTILTKIDEAKSADYTFVVFSGHGEVKGYKPIQYLETMDKNITVDDLIVKSYSKKQTIIVDACREWNDKPSIKLQEILNESKNAIIPNSRTLFENEIKKVNGLNILYSSSLDQSSEDTDNGGVFISELLQYAINWGENVNDSSNILNNYVVTASVIKKLHNKGYSQTPEIIPKNGQNNNYYPFAIKNIRV